MGRWEAEDSCCTFHNHPERNWMGRRETLGASVCLGVREGQTEWVRGLARSYVHVRLCMGIG